MNLAFRQAFSRVRASAVAALLLPVLIASAAESPAPPAKEAAVSMQPFRVFAGWMDIQPLLNRGVIESVRIAHVRPNTPAAAAGLKAGMRILAFQDIDVVGLKEAEFIARMDALPPSDSLRLKIAGGVLSAARTVTLATVRSTAPVESATPPPPEPPPPAAEMTEAQVQKLIAGARRQLEEDVHRTREEARATGRGQTDTRLLPRLTKELGQALPAHLVVLCEAALKADRSDEMDARFLRDMLVNAINDSHEHRPEQREVLLKYLPKLPDLILALDKQQWLDGTTDAAVAAGWKKAKSTATFGVPKSAPAAMLSYRTARYARIAARHGVADAL
ncbi:MAG TPA: PDZ domain-containing protein, partial [Opitutaceae bacterium]